MPNRSQIENPRKTPSAGWRVQPALFVFALTAILCLSRCAAGSTQLSLSSDNLSFGNVTVGTRSTLAVTLTNTGTRSVWVARDTVRGTGFSVSGLALPLTLGVSQGTTFDVSFAPAAAGSVTGSVSIVTSARNLTLNISLSGTGVGVGQPTASLSPTTLAFGSQAVGTTSSAQTSTLSNTGNAALSISSIRLTGANPGDFAQSNNCGGSVAAGASCTVSVTFIPAASGSFAASVTLTDNATGSPQTATLSGTGGSTNPVVSLSTTTLSFGNEPIDEASSSQTITLSNTGSAALSITGLAIAGANASDFAEIADTCGSSVAAGANCTIAVTFTPSLASAETASVTITDNAGGSPQSVSLSGTGTHDIILSWTAGGTSGVVGYDVYRGTTSGGESTTPLNSSPIAGTTYTDSNVQAGQKYYYVVTALNSTETTQSADSNETSATVP